MYLKSGEYFTGKKMDKNSIILRYVERGGADVYLKSWSSEMNNSDLFIFSSLLGVDK